MAAQRNLLLFAGVALLFILTGVFQSWNLSLNILNLALLSCIMAIGVNIQWGYAGLFSTGIVGSVALGGLAVVLVFVGLKMVWLNNLFDGKFPISLSLGIIIGVIAVSVILSLLFPGKPSHLPQAGRDGEQTTTDKRLEQAP